MPKKFLKRFTPDQSRWREHTLLKKFGTLLHHPNLWHMNRRSVPGAFSVGLFVAFVPIPFQMLLAAILAILFRVNLPISVTLVWITNPFTMAPMFYFAYWTGAKLLHETPYNIDFELSVQWLLTRLGEIWEPFLLGCLLIGLLCAIGGNLLIRSLWLVQVRKSWRLRSARRLLRKKSSVNTHNN